MTEAIDKQPGSAKPQNGTAAIAAAAPRTGDAPAVAPKSASRRYLMVGAVALALALGVGVYMLLTAGKESTDDAQVSADLVPVGTRVSGQVTVVHIQENQLVKKGDPIADIDDA